MRACRYLLLFYHIQGKKPRTFRGYLLAKQYTFSLAYVLFFVKPCFDSGVPLLVRFYFFRDIAIPVGSVVVVVLV